MRCRVRELLPALGVLAVAAAAVESDYLVFGGPRPYDEIVANYTLGDAYRQAGEAREALAAQDELHARLVHVAVVEQEAVRVVFDIGLGLDPHLDGEGAFGRQLRYGFGSTRGTRFILG